VTVRNRRADGALEVPSVTAVERLAILRAHVLSQVAEEEEEIITRSTTKSPGERIAIHVEGMVV
jgi:hypothetical protein